MTSRPETHDRAISGEAYFSLGGRRAAFCVGMRKGFEPADGVQVSRLGGGAVGLAGRRCRLAAGPLFGLKIEEL